MNYIAQKAISYAFSNAGYVEGLEEEIKAQHPKWTDEEVAEELIKVREKGTNYNAKNKKPKKPKKVKEPK